MLETPPRRPSTRLVLAALLAGLAGCARVAPIKPTADAGGGTGPPSVDAGSARDLRPVAPDGGACTRVTCNPLGGLYGGVIGDG